MSIGRVATPPQSRRDRPAKPPLSRGGIIDAALEILEQEGLRKVTMRRIAAALDTGPASLYVYVRDTEELHAQILDALIGRMAPPSKRGSWRERLTALLSAYGAVLFAHPEIARMTMTTHPAGPNYFSLVETILQLLEAGGVPDDVAAWAVDLLLASVTASAVEHGTMAATGGGDQVLSAMAEDLATASSATYPRITRLGDEMLSGTGPERFAWGLDVLLNGVLSTPRATARP